MKKFAGTNIKTISKVSEYINADAVDIAYDSLDYARAESVKNGVKISSQKGSRRIIDRNRNAIAHEQVDYSQFKVTKIERGQTVDNSKKEKQLEDAAISLLADLGISWDDDENEADDTVENEEQQTDNNEEQHEYRLEIQKVSRSDDNVPSLTDRKYITFNSTVNDAIATATELLKEINPANCWGAELWNQTMRYRMEYKWDVDNKYEQFSYQYCWIDWTGKQI